MTDFQSFEIVLWNFAFQIIMYKETGNYKD